VLIATSEVASVAHVIDVASGHITANLPVGSRPREALFLKGGREAWVSSEQRGTIAVIALRARRVVRTIDLVAAFPELPIVQAVEMEASRDGRTVYVALGRGDGVAEIDAATHAIGRRYPTGHRTWGIALSPDGRRLYAAAGLSGTLTIVDLAHGGASKTIDLGGKPWTVEAAPR
jgi:YVTN family beta-propeller protein